MKPSEDLFRLIKSLSSSEKRYFRLFARQHVIGNKNNYLQLFEAIHAQKEYDQVALYELPFVKNLSAEKNYLHNLILKCMRSFCAGTSPDQRINDQIRNHEFLQKKGLYADAKRALSKARKLAFKFEKLHYLPWIMEEEATIVKRDKQKDLELEIARISTEKSNVVRLITLEAELAAIYHSVFTIARKARKLASSETLKQIDSLLQNELSSPLPKSATVQTQLYFHQAHYMIYQIKKEPANAHPHFERIVELIEAFPDIIDHFNRRYRTSLSNLLVSAYTNNLLHLFPTILEKLKNTPSDSYDEEAEVFQNLAYLEMIYFLNQGKWAQAEELVPEIEDGLTKFANHINKARELAIIYNIALLYFVLENMPKTMSWLNRIIDNKKTEHRSDIQTATQLLQLTIFFDRGEMDLLEHRIRTFKRGVGSRRDFTAFETLVLDFLEKSINCIGGKELRSLLMQFHQDLKETDKATQLAFECREELTIWSKARITGKSIRAVASEMVGKTGEL